MRTTHPTESNRAYHDAISQRARQIWHDRGCPEGQDVEIWLEAERDLVGRGVVRPAPPEPATPRRAQRRGQVAADEIDERELADRLADFGPGADRSATSLDPTRP